MAYTTPRRPPRENDIGHLIDLARQCGLYVHQDSKEWVRLQDTRTRAIPFEGKISLAVEFVKQRMS